MKLLIFLAFAAAMSMAGIAGIPGGEVSIVFDQEPKLSGMTFDRQAMKASTLEDQGKQIGVWVAGQGSAPEVPWGRSIRMSISDPAFKRGAMPVVDIEIVYRNNANAPFEILADTSRGSVRIEGGYGKQTTLQTQKIRLEDAFFGNRAFGNPPNKSQTDGYDLRINAYNEDFEIRSIRVKGYDLASQPDFSRLLKLESIVTAPDDIFLFAPNQKPKINFGLRNSARKPFSGRATFTVRDDSEKMLFEEKSDLQLAAAGRTEIPCNLNTADLKYGVYYVDFQLWEKTSHDPKPLLEKRISFGVASGAKLAKAKPGEFLYGLDVRLGGAYHNPLLLRWADEMGVDILRHGFDAEDNFEEVAAQLPTYDRAGLQVMFICGAPWNENAVEREKTIEHRGNFLEKLSASFKQIHFFELGNEPDLRFFYGGPIENYAADYEKLYDAVKRGNPATTVTNGGLSFFAEGDERSRKFIERVNPDKLDALAYHGHGPGVEAERSAFVRAQKALLQHGKFGKPLVETESGMAAKSLSQQQEQARTVIQKMVYAQSERLPLLMWFRLIMFEEDYGSLNSDREPRPSIIAYRALVETLRGYTFSQSIDLGKEGVEGYLFTQNGGPGRACVLWSNEPAFHTAYVAAGPKADNVLNPRLIDMDGNSTAADLLGDGVLRAPVTEDPVFLKWETATPDFLVQRAPSIIDLPPVAQLAFNTNNPLTIEVRNPSDQPLQATLAAAIKADLTASVTPKEQSLSFAPREVKKIDYTVRLDSSKQTVAWPEDWTVFVNVDEKATDLSKLSASPETLIGSDGKPIRGNRVFPRNNLIDFTELGGVAKERSAAIIFAEIESQEARTVRVGAGADWWMQWFVNGQVVFDTLAKGNEGATTVTAHTFDLPLRKGRNLIAVKILSGSGGWKFAVAGPDALSQAGTAKTSLDHLEFTLSGNGKTIASEKLALHSTVPIPSLGGIALADPVSKWELRKPAVVFDEKSVSNLFNKAPDFTRWWQGAADFSGRAWLTFDRTKIYYVVKVIDDVFASGPTTDFDSLQIVFSRNGLDGFNEYVVGMKDRQPHITKSNSSSGLPNGELASNNPEISATIERIESSESAPAFTVYRISLDREMVGGDAFFTNLLINDRDADVRKQYLTWCPGIEGDKEPKLWYRATLEK